MSGELNLWYGRLAATTFVLSLALVVVSALMRLSNQGLGCADWPACYGLVDITRYARDIDTSVSGPAPPSAYLPIRLVEGAHRVVASLLQLAVIAVAVMALRSRKDENRKIAVPLVLLGLSLFLAVLGIWYGSPLLRPPVVMANLLGGMAIMGLSWWLWLSLRRESGSVSSGSRRLRALRNWAVVALAAIGVQIALGGWMGANFAALACTTFPDCNGSWWPAMNFTEGYALRPTLDVSSDGKVITSDAAATAIHMAHRMSAIVVVLLVGWLAYRSTRLGGRFRAGGITLMAALSAQVLLGVTVVLFNAPLTLVVLHNAIAALLLLIILTLVYRSSGNAV